MNSCNSFVAIFFNIKHKVNDRANEARSSGFKEREMDRTCNIIFYNVCRLHVYGGYISDETHS